MGVSDTLGKEVKGIALLVIVIVLFTVVLTKIKNQNISNSICSGTHGYYNASGDICCNGTASTLTNCAGTLNQTSISTLGNSMNTATGALDEPITWLAIIVIIIVVAWLMKYLKNKKSGM